MAVTSNQAPGNKPLNPNIGLHLCSQTPPRQPHLLIRVPGLNVFVLRFLFPLPLPRYSPKDADAACKVITAISIFPPAAATVSLTYMVKSPAAVIPCCKTISPCEKL